MFVLIFPFIFVSIPHRKVQYNFLWITYFLTVDEPLHIDFPPWFYIIIWITIVSTVTRAASSTRRIFITGVTESAAVWGLTKQSLIGPRAATTRKAVKLSKRAGTIVQTNWLSESSKMVILKENSITAMQLVTIQFFQLIIKNIVKIMYNKLIHRI